MEDKKERQVMGFDDEEWKVMSDTVTSAIDNLRVGRHFIFIAKELLEVL